MSPTTKTIGPLDLAAERAVVGPAVDEAVLRVLASGRYVLGPEVEAFEEAFARLCGVDHGVGVASGTDALVLGLLALGVKPGDHVVTSPFTFFASAATIAWIGAKPVFADVEPDTGLVDPGAVATAIDGHTTCIVPVHLYGQVCDMVALRGIANERGLALLEDAAQSHGAARDGHACGSLGDLAAFSFYPTKNLGAAGEGGLLATRRPELAARVRTLRDHGSRAKYDHAEIGTNSRLQAVQAAVLNAKLPHLGAWNERRRAIAARYDAGFADVPALAPLVRRPGAEHVYHQYAVRVGGDVARDVVVQRLHERGVMAAVHYPRPVHVQDAARAWGYGPGDFPAAEALAASVVCLPVHPFLDDASVDRVIDQTRLAAGA